MVPRIAMLAACAGLSFALPAAGQTRSPQPPRAAAPAPATAPAAQQWFHGPIAEVNLQELPAREAFDWWSRMTGIDLVIDWDALAAAGVDLQTPITLELKDVMASRVLSLLMQVMSPEVELVYEATPWYVQVMTKAEANKHLVVRVYDVGDLVMEVPNFSGAPTFNLVEIVAESNARQRARGLFGDDYGAGQDRRAQREAATAEKEAREQMRGEELAQAIRETIEPGIWDGVANVRYHHGLLIVKAPAYVHGDLGLRDVQPPPAARPAEPVEVERHRGEERFTQPISGIAPTVQSVSGVR